MRQKEGAWIGNRAVLRWEETGGKELWHPPGLKVESKGHPGSCLGKVERGSSVLPPKFVVQGERPNRRSFDSPPPN
jgi:hypothetical protein